MKIYQSLAVIVSAVVVLISCRKMDSIAENKPANSSELSATNSKETGWITPASWQLLQTKKSSVTYFVIEDSKMTRAISTKGLVLVYKKNGNTINTLPFEEISGSNYTYWFYQVSENRISINKEGNSLLNAPDENDSFLYYVLPEEQVSALKDKGYSRDKLMQVSYETITALLN